MYMFFWFFKQLYYCLRRIFKSGILLLFLFFIAFIFFFVKPTFAFEYNDIDFTEITGWNYTCYVYDTGQNNNYVAYASNSGPFYVSTVNNFTSLQHNPSNSGISRWFWQNNQWVNQSTTSYWDYLLNLNNSNNYIMYSSEVIYHTDGSVYFDPTPTPTEPYITNTSSNITSWNYEDLSINGTTYITNNSNAYLHFFYGSGAQNYTSINCTPYISLNTNDSTYYINIPRSLIEESYIISSGVLVGFDLLVQNPTERWYSNLLFQLR